MEGRNVQDVCLYDKNNNISQFDELYRNGYRLGFSRKSSSSPPSASLATRWSRNWSKGISWRFRNRRSVHGCSTSMPRCGWNRRCIGLPGKFPDGIYNSFPFDSIANWNIRDFKPIYIPKTGDCLTMNRGNYILYRKLIEWEQKENRHR